MKTFPKVITPDMVLKFHPLCEAVPEMGVEEFAMRQTGYHVNPSHMEDAEVLLIEDEGEWKILDGRHTYLIAQSLGLNVKAKKFVGTFAEATEIVETRNLDRRHLKPSQIVATRALLNKMNGRENSPRELERQADVNTAAAYRAAKIANDGPKELLKAVVDDSVSLMTAEIAVTVDVPEEEIQKALKAEKPQEALKEAIETKSPGAHAKNRDGRLRQEVREKKSPEKKASEKPCPCAAHMTCTSVPMLITDENGKQTVKDGFGTVLPDRTGDKFGDTQIVNFIGILQELSKEVAEKLEKVNLAISGGTYLWINDKQFRKLESQIAADMDEVINTLKDGLPYAGCPNCQANGRIPEKGVPLPKQKHCQACHGTGYWPLCEVNDGDNYKLFPERKKAK